MPRNPNNRHRRFAVRVDRLPGADLHRGPPPTLCVRRNRMSLAIESRASTPDFATIKQRQQATWASGDFAVIGTTLQIVGESLAEAVNVRAGERVLDVAAGNGN